MSLKKTLFRLVICIFFFNAAWAQNKTISDVVSFKLRNLGPILQESEVSGYYMFYQTDRLSKDLFSYEYMILDQNLNQINLRSIEGSNYLSLVDGVYNNNSLLLKFYDSMSRQLSLIQYNNNADEISKTLRKVNNFEARILAQTIINDEGQNFTVFPINEVGFVDFRSVKNKSYGYSIDFYPSSKNKEKWSISSDENSKIHEFSSFIYGDQNIILSSIVKKNSLFSKSIDISLLAINAKTGVKLYEKAITDENYELFPLNGLGDDTGENIYLFGNYYPKGKNELSSSSLGLFSAKLDIHGNILEKHFTSWSDDVSRFVDVNEKGKLENGGYIYFHDIVRDSDGKVYAIGEQYKKSMKGILTDMITEDMIIFEFGSDYKLQKINIVDKERSSITLPRGMGINGSQILAYYLKSIGGFDYEFLQFNKDHSIFSIGYLDYVKVKGEQNKYIFGIISYVDGSSTFDSVDLMNAKEKKSIKVMPAKTGNIAIVEYLPKEKTLNMRIEKLNY